MSGWWWWQLSVSLRWPMMSELSGWLWPTDSDSDGPMVGSKLSRAASHSAEAGAGVFVNRLQRVGSRCRGWERSEEIDKSKTLITTGYSASPVNMGLIWGHDGPSVGIIGSPQTKTCTKKEKVLCHLSKRIAIKEYCFLVTLKIVVIISSLIPYNCPIIQFLLLNRFYRSTTTTMTSLPLLWVLVFCKESSLLLMIGLVSRYRDWISASALYSQKLWIEESYWRNSFFIIMFFVELLL